MFASILLATVGTSHAAQADDMMSWDWSSGHRYYMETQVHLPLMMWFATGFNKQARVDTFELKLVADCAPGERETRKVWEVTCLLEDVSLSAESLPQEEGLVQPIVVELDALLTGASVQLQIRDDGRLVNIDLEDAERRNRRFGRINENMRLILSRAFAGLDLPLSTRGEDAWMQHSSWITRAPATEGSVGSSEIIHKIVAREGSMTTIATGGRAIVVPAEGLNNFDTRIWGETTFDTATGRILDRTWSLRGGPTASSAIATGGAGFPYLQEGRIVALSEGQTWDVGESREIPATGQHQSAIQQSFLGTNPNGDAVEPWGL